MSVANLVPAAQYLRMSTEHQQYSPDNQAAAIAEYAAMHGFEIVKTYLDSARTGVVIRNRVGLQRLLEDVTRHPEYRAVLVYDVSRWGRFQDVDESAYYEYVCKNAGIPVHYCAEQFTTKGTLVDLILKNLKRVMAAEFSREMGERIVRGQRRFVEMGYKMGGAATYGMRRLLIAPDGTPKQILRPNERKSISTDRVTLVLGPDEEVEVVRMMFRLVLERGFRAQAITDFLNAAGIPFFDGRKWERCTVHNLLTNPKYAGVNPFGRTVCRMYAPQRPTPRDTWLLKPGAFPAIVDQETFNAVQQFLGASRWTDEELLEGLREVWKREGVVSQESLASAGYGPCYTTVVSHFGTFRKALDLIGYAPIRNYQLARKYGKHTQKLHRALLRKLAHQFPKRVKVMSKHRSPKRALLFDGKYRVEVLLLPPRSTSERGFSWSTNLHNQGRNCPNLCCFLSQDCSRIEIMYLVASLPEKVAKLTIRPGSTWFDSATKVRSVRSFAKTLEFVIGREVSHSAFAP